MDTQDTRPSDRTLEVGGSTPPGSTCAIPYLAQTVNIAARIDALADPSEVLVSRTVRDLVAGSALSCVDRGERALKGVPETWKVYAAEGRPA